MERFKTLAEDENFQVESGICGAVNRTLIITNYATKFGLDMPVTPELYCFASVGKGELPLLS